MFSGSVSPWDSSDFANFDFDTLFQILADIPSTSSEPPVDTPIEEAQEVAMGTGCQTDTVNTAVKQTQTSYDKPLTRTKGMLMSCHWHKLGYLL